jgi:hypothetical protein
MPQLCAVPKKRVGNNLGAADSLAAGRLVAGTEDVLYGDHLFASCLLLLQLTLHRRGQRRQWYALKKRTEMGMCSFCGAVGGKDSLLSGAVGNTRCTGQCVEQLPTRQYPPEYKPPC